MKWIKVMRAGIAVGLSVVGRVRTASRRPVLTVGGLACYVLAAWDVSRVLGLLAAGSALLVLEVLTKPAGES